MFHHFENLNESEAAIVTEILYATTNKCQRYSKKLHSFFEYLLHLFIIVLKVDTSFFVVYLPQI
jgi:hypothetical protein